MDMTDGQPVVGRRDAIKLLGATVFGIAAGGGLTYAATHDDIALLKKEQEKLLDENESLRTRNTDMEQRLSEDLTGADNFRPVSQAEYFHPEGGIRTNTMQRIVWNGDPEIVTMESPIIVDAGKTFDLIYRWDSTKVPKEQRGGIFVTHMLYTDWATTAKMKKYQPRMPGRPISDVELPLTPYSGLRMHPDEESFKRLFEGGDGTELDATYKKFETKISIKAPDYPGTRRIRMLHTSHWGTIAGFNGTYMIDGIHNPRPRWDENGNPDTGIWIIPNYTLTRLTNKVPGLQLTIDVV